MTESPKPWSYIAHEGECWIGVISASIGRGGLIDAVGGWAAEGCSITTAHSRQEFQALMASMKALERAAGGCAMSPEDKLLCRAIEARGDEILDGLKSSSAGERHHWRAVNWADLRVVEVARCELPDDTVEYRVLVEEAAPDCGLGPYMTDLLTAQFGVRIAVDTEW